MRKNVLYFLLILILSSCGTSRNFNRQKFTTLKKVKPTEIVQELTDDQPEKKENVDFTESYSEDASIPASIESGAEAVVEKTESNNDLEAEHKASEELGFRPFNFTPSTKKLIQANERKKGNGASEDRDDNLLKINTFIFFIGLAGIIVQFLAFILILAFDIEALLSFSWTGLMAVSLVAGFIGVACLLAAFVISMIYKQNCRKKGKEPNRGRWYSIWITSLILAIVFVGNLLFTALIFINEFI